MKVMRVSKKFQVGDLVWAKMRGYPKWPGEIIEPHAKSKPKKSHHYVLFFGSGDHAWIPDKNILLHNEVLIKEWGSQRKSSVFQKAVKELVEKNSKKISNYTQYENCESNSNSESNSNNEYASPKCNDGESHLEKHAISDTSPKGAISQSNYAPKNLQMFQKFFDTKDLNKSPNKTSNLDYSAEEKDKGDKDSEEASKNKQNEECESNGSSSSAYASPNSNNEESHIEKYVISDTSPKDRIFHPNSVPKELNFSDDKCTYLKKSPNKRSNLDYCAEEENESNNYQCSPSKRYKFELDCECLVANVSPNINYGEDSIHSPVHSKELLSKEYIKRPEIPLIDLVHEGETRQDAKRIGFVGLEKIAQGIFKNLQRSGHSFVVLNRTSEECYPFVEQRRIQTASTPADVVVASDITFCCVSDIDAAKALVFGKCGILKGLETSPHENKGYVQMTSMDPKTSQVIAEEIKMKSGRYLEAPLNGSTIEAHEGTLFILAAGDHSLYDECKSCLDAATKKHMFVSSEVGTACKLNLIHSMFIGTVYATLAETLTLVSRAGLQGEDFLEILKHGELHSEGIINKGISMIKKDYISNISLKHMQNDLNAGLMLGNSVETPTYIIAAANEVYKRCKLRYGNYDVSAVFEGINS